jgi:hypothetical protein
MKMNLKTIMMTTTLFMGATSIFAATSDPVGGAVPAQTVRQVHAHGLDLRIAIPTEDQTDKFRTLIGIHCEPDEETTTSMRSTLSECLEQFHPDSIQYFALRQISNLLGDGFHKRGEEELSTMSEYLECAAGLFSCAEPAFEMGGVMISPGGFPTEPQYIESIKNAFAPEQTLFHAFAQEMQARLIG